MDDQKKTLGRSLKELRGTRRFTLREVEEFTGISNAYLSQLENEKIGKPSAKMLYKLATLYKIEFDVLLEIAGIIEKKEKKKGPKTLSGHVLYSESLSASEEEALTEYLRFLRYSKDVGDGEE